MTTKRLTTISMLIAMKVILSILTPVKLLNFKFTFEAFPILAAGLLFGKLEGFLVGFIGSFLYQLLFSGYGFTATTILWILPHALSGLAVGYLAGKKKDNLNFNTISLIAIFSALLVTTLNTLALFIDAKVYGYYSKALVFGSIPLKIISGIMLAVIYATLLPKTIELIKKIAK
ncbi:MAG: folate family ECF transporter S component [Bacillota bacterium]|jgi:ECF transporter S component (folate family)|nr:folate family ECF transporter S component [Bacillota bacterium]NLL27125.1 folate family ECF transporter S component [Erysipelotrichia bacterium]